MAGNQSGELSIDALTKTRKVRLPQLIIAAYEKQAHCPEWHIRVGWIGRGNWEAVVAAYREILMVMTMRKRSCPKARF